MLSLRRRTGTCSNPAASAGASVRKQSTFPARNMLPIAFMKRPRTGLSFEIRISTHATINTVLPEETGLNPDSVIQFMTGSVLFDQFQGRTPITRH